MATPATSELVVAAWLATLPGIASAMVGAQLPTDITTWAATGFVQTGLDFGRSPMYVPVRAPIMELTVWGVNPGTNTPNWKLAADLAGVIVDACYRNLSLGVPLQLPEPGYRQAQVKGAWPVRDPQRENEDITNFAKYTLDVEFRWTEIPE